MIRKLSLTLAFSLGIGLLNPLSAEAVPLTRAVIRLLRNEVNLIPQGRSPRQAEVSDALTPGDALSTARQSFAEVEFNDGSLARVGESVLFRFISDTRTFRLNNGTMLLLIPPGQGRTRVRTPNATAGIRGSALFIRHNSNEDDPEMGVTLVGALTNSEITVCSSGEVDVCTGESESEDEQVILEAGEIAVVSGGEIVQIYEFDLETFYQTSILADGLGSAEPDSTSSVNSRVQAEIREGLETARFPEDSGDSILVNPDFTTSSDLRREAPLLIEPDGIDSPGERVNSTFTDSETITDIQTGDSTDPAEPADPVEPTDPVEPVEPIDPIDPVEPTDPVEPIEPIEPTDPVEPVEPAEPIEPIEPIEQPVEPPIELPGEPVEPPIEPPVEPVEPPIEPPVEPIEPIEPIEPLPPEGPAGPEEGPGTEVLPEG